MTPSIIHMASNGKGYAKRKNNTATNAQFQADNKGQADCEFGLAFREHANRNIGKAMRRVHLDAFPTRPKCHE